MFDIEMRYLAASPRWCAAHRLDRATLVGRNCYDLNPQLSEEWREVHVRCLAGTAESGERQIRVLADGSPVWVRWEARPWRTDAGEIAGVVVRFENITAEKEAQLAAAAREHQLQIALEASKAGTWLADPRTRRLIWDKPSQAIYGVGPDADVTTIEDVQRLVAPEDRDRIRAMSEHIRTLADGQSWGDEFRIVHPDGTVRWVYCCGQTHRDDSGALVRIAGINLDVTDRKLAEATAQRSEQQARLALEAASAFAWHWNLDEGPWIVEPHVASRIGVPPGQPFQPAAYLARVHPDDRAAVQAALTAAGKDGGLPGWDVEYRLTFPDRPEVWFHSRGRVERDATGRARRLFGIMMDVTNRRRAERDLVRSHVVLRAHAAELERRTTQLQRLASALILAEQRAGERLAKRLHDHVQELLFSALLHVQRAAADAPGLVVLRQAQRDLTDAIDGIAIAVTSDALANPSPDDGGVLVFEAVRELPFNVVKHAGVEQAGVTLALDDAGRVRITVADAGVGLDPTTLAARPGSDDGLGSFGMRERVALFEGRLQAGRAPGQGARLTIVVAHAQAGTATPAKMTLDGRGEEPVAAGPAEGPRPLRILLADDHATVRGALRHVLDVQPALLVVGEAADGIEAVNLARTLAPDVIIMDMWMPRMDGIEATRRIRACVRGARIFGLSTEQESLTPHAMEQAGAEGYFFKGAGLVRLVERLLRVHAEVCGR